jgi:hypothetical protein
MRRSELMPGSRRASQARRAGRRLQLESLEDRALFALSPLGLVTADECRGEPAPIVASLTLPAGIEQHATSVAESAAAPTAASPLWSLPRLSSNPAAAAKLFLDFDGRFETSWGSNTNVTTPVYDRDGDRSSFSDAELAAIQETWARVAEDYAPFNIDVTTIDPGTAANRVAAVVAIGGSAADWYGPSSGGVAYVGGFYNGASNVGYVFEDNLGNGNPKYVGEAASHEAGHLFGLSHQALWSGSTLVQAYNPGNAAWAPVMGVGYSASRTTWHNGPTLTAATLLQDDLSILANGNNAFGYKADDFGDSAATAAPLPVSGSSVNFAGLIGRNGDADYWSFTTAGGQVNLQLAVAAVGANLDAVLELRNAAGQAIVSSAPADLLGASVSTTVGAGTYYLVARSNGDYGNLGQYTISGSLPGTVTPPAPPPPPPVSTAQIIDNGDAGFSTSGAWIPWAGQGYQNDVHYAAAGNGTTVARWSANVTPGQYRVAVSWSPQSNRATNSPYTVYDGSTSLGAVAVNQQLSPADFSAAGIGWKSLGTFNITGSSMSVALGDNANNYVIADAVHIERIGDLPTTPPPQPPAPPPSATTQFIDNGDAGFSTAGSWIPFAGQGNQSDVHYALPGAGTDVARWTAAVAPGQYKVAVTWSPLYNRATDAPFSVYDGNTRLSTTAVNQQLAPADFTDQGVAWKSLGTVTVSGNSLKVELGNNANWHVIADAVRIERVGDLPPTRIINDTDPGFSTVGSWIAYAGQGFQSDVHYTSPGWGGSGARWSADVTPGQYQIAATWSEYYNRATNSPFTVFDGSTSLGTTAVNQQLAPSDFTDQNVAWKSLGTFSITGSTLTVLLADNANSFVIADAIRIQRVGELPAALDDHDAHDHDHVFEDLAEGRFELEILPLPEDLV